MAHATSQTRSSRTGCRRTTSWSWSQRSPRRPIFIIHAGHDDAGHRGPDYFRAAREPKQIWEAQGGHTDGIDREPKEYERRVTAFFDGALLE